ncbi:MAG: hypothetical protein HY270_24720 [Deltaproteobacteria bacterium]|nr:hypothetical protein [Deltaproteobacteria bacterium]
MTTSVVGVAAGEGRSVGVADGGGAHRDVRGPQIKVSQSTFFWQGSSTSKGGTQKP